MKRSVKMAVPGIVFIVSLVGIVLFTRLLMTIDNRILAFTF